MKKETQSKSIENKTDNNKRKTYSRYAKSNVLL